MKPKALFLLLPLALAGCGGGATQDNGVDTLDQELANGTADNAADPLLTGALQDQIMVDPQVPATGVAGGTAPDPGPLMATPPPVAGGCPACRVTDESMTLGALTGRQQNIHVTGCVAKMRYGAGWANRLPRDIPLYGNARVVEAAGVQDAQCSLRAVTFTAPVPLQAMLDWYYTRAARAGYTAEHQSDGTQHVLGGTRNRDGGAYVLYLTVRDGGTAVDLVANNGQ